MPYRKPNVYSVLGTALVLLTLACAPNVVGETGHATTSSTTRHQQPATTTDPPIPTTSPPPTTAASGSVSTTSTEPEETTTTTSAPTSTTAAPPTTAFVAPTVAITRFGIPVRVSEVTDQSWLVIDPCGDAKEVSTAFPVRETEVVLDPGHGGKDPGARGPTGLKESELNLRVALAVSQRLQEKEIRTLLTRTGDYYIELDERVALGDAANSAALVSIHHNAPIAAASNRPGTEVFAQTGDDQSARLAGLLHEYVFEALSTIENLQWTSRWDAGALRVVNSEGADAYSLVRKPQTTNALLEIAYLASPSEGQFLATDEYVQLIAHPIATAIETFLTTDQLGTPLLNRPRVHNPSGGRRTCPTVDLE